MTDNGYDDREERLRRAYALANSISGDGGPGTVSDKPIEKPAPTPAAPSEPAPTPAAQPETPSHSVGTAVADEPAKGAFEPVKPPASKEAPPLSEPRRKPRRRRLGILGVIRLISIIVIVLAALFLVDRFTSFKPVEKIKNAIVDITSGAKVTELDFQNAVLGESRYRQMLVVYEKDVTVDSELSQALLNLDVFKKTQLVRSYGTGFYAVDMSKITADHISVDAQSKTVKVIAPACVLYVVDYDVTKSEYGETEKALLAFGDIKLTAEEQNLFEKSVDKAINDALENQALFEEADKAAVSVIADTLLPAVRLVDDEYTVTVVVG